MPERSESTEALLPAMHTSHAPAADDIPLLSIVTVCFRAAATIGRTFESIRAERLPGIEYLVIDGGSDDGTLDLIHRNADLIDRMVCEPDRGIFDAMNKGARLARGRFLWFLNADDYLTPGAIACVVDRIRAGFDSPDAILVGLTQRVDERDEPTRIDRFHLPQPHKGEPAPAFPDPSTAMPRPLLDQLGGFAPNLRIAGDYDLLWRAARLAAPVATIERILTVMREGGTSSRSAPLRVRAQHESEVFSVQARHAGIVTAVRCHLHRQWRAIGRLLSRFATGHGSTTVL
jgi:glycosyltransferase involved in cell wall biosynthesis